MERRPSVRVVVGPRCAHVGAAAQEDDFDEVEGKLSFQCSDIA